MLLEETHRRPSWGRVLNRDRKAAIKLAGWAHHAFTATAVETASSPCPGPGPAPTAGCEVRTGIAPQHTAPIGGAKTAGRFVRF